MINKANCFFQHILACGCSSSGASSVSCTSSGVCTCKSRFVGDKCDSCKAGFYDYPNCYGKIQYNIWQKYTKIQTIIHIVHML